MRKDYRRYAVEDDQEDEPLTASQRVGCFVIVIAFFAFWWAVGMAVVRFMWSGGEN